MWLPGGGTCTIQRLWPPWSAACDCWYASSPVLFSLPSGSLSQVTLQFLCSLVLHGFQRRRGGQEPKASRRHIAVAPGSAWVSHGPCLLLLGSLFSVVQIPTGLVAPSTALQSLSCSCSSLGDLTVPNGLSFWHCYNDFLLLQFLSWIQV